MKDFQIYLSSGMGTLSLQEQTQWREKVRKYLGQYELVNTKLVFSDLTDYFAFQSRSSGSEIMNFDLRNVKSSDLILVYFNDAQAVNMIQELTIGWEYRIPIIGIETGKVEVDSRLRDSCDKVFSDIYSACDYIIDFYLR